MVHRRPVYIHLLNVPSFSSRYFNKIKRTSRLGRVPALSLEILCSGKLVPLLPTVNRGANLCSHNGSRLGDKVSTFSQHFQNCKYWVFGSTVVLNNDAILFIYLFDCSSSENIVLKNTSLRIKFKAHLSEMYLFLLHEKTQPLSFH